MSNRQVRSWNVALNRGRMPQVHVISKLQTYKDRQAWSIHIWYKVLHSLAGLVRSWVCHYLLLQLYLLSVEHSRDVTSCHHWQEGHLRHHYLTEILRCLKHLCPLCLLSHLHLLAWQTSSHTLQLSSSVRHCAPAASTHSTHIQFSVMVYEALHAGARSLWTTCVLH